MFSSDGKYSNFIYRYAYISLRIGLSQRVLIQRAVLATMLAWALLAVLSTFTPAQAHVDAYGALHPDVAVQPQVPEGCRELVMNGGFEAPGTGWTILSSERPAEYDNSLAYEGQRSMRLGIVNVSDVASASEAEQTISLPGDASSIVLAFHYYPQYDNDPGIDLQRVDIYNTLTNPPQFLARTLSALRNDRAWILHQDDLTAYAGQQIKLRLGVDNDGVAGRTAMYVDNVSILACGSTVEPTPTHTPTPTFTPTFSLNTPTVTPSFTPITPVVTPVTPIPTLPATPISPFVCPDGQAPTDLLTDGGFETGTHWTIGQDPVPPRYTNAQVYNGAQAMLLGNSPELGLANVVTYSSVRQMVTIPHSATLVQLRWWAWPQSQESAASTLNRWQDRQDVILLDAHLKPIQILHRQRVSSGWREEASGPLQAYRGRPVYIYFNVFNNENSNRTWMYLDDVRLLACMGPQMQPYQKPHQQMPPATMIPATPTPTAQQQTVTETATISPTETATSSPTEPPPPVTATFTPTPTIVPPPTQTSMIIPTETPSVSQENPSASNRLGTVVVLALVLVVIGLLANMFSSFRSPRTRPPSNHTNT